MALARWGQALGRSMAALRNETARIMRMEVTAERSEDVQLLYRFATPQDAAQVAIGADADIGGLSRCQFSFESEARPGGAPETFGRFYGTISSHIPRGSRLERSGYAAFRNVKRPRLFSVEAWDTSMHPYLALKVRNRLPRAIKSEDTPAGAGPSLRAALQTQDGTGSAVARAVEALGCSVSAAVPPPMPPLFYVNIQTDGPVTTDLYQHRLCLDERADPNEWQTVTIPLDAFVLTNTGVVSDVQVSMLREKVLTVGLSVLMEPPQLPQDGASAVMPAVRALRRSDGASEASDAPGVRGRQRDTSLPFDLDVAGVWVVATPTDAARL
ncbi:hypothetical protein MNAN1_003028 [Malassezia nana]|uniref:NADH:ubiquinone oxidoreductase intermediate-associated protein 30 domain-containing protein n=1 Tax=Malassezia nana TaxID=180528 RepID=A0AAF0EL44_9BASI|nr:hypothetical protein MNAN1_003028 [Malassezia nana]